MHTYSILPPYILDAACMPAGGVCIYISAETRRKDVSCKPEGIQHHLRADKLMLEKNLLIELRRQKEEGAQKKERSSSSVSSSSVSMRTLLSFSVSMRTLLCQHENTSLPQCLFNKI